MDRAQLEYRLVDAPELPLVRRLVAGAYLDEEFAVGGFGHDPVERFVGLSRMYADWPRHAGAVVWGAFLEGVVVAAACVHPSGRCPSCEEWNGVSDLDDGAAAAPEAEFVRNCLEVHRAAALPPHAHVSVVAVEPQLRGLGLGELLMREMIRRLRADGAAAVVLECVQARVAFYGRLGFQPIGDFAEPAVPGLRFSVMKLNLPPSG